MRRPHIQHADGIALVGTDSEWSTIANALRLAADTYAKLQSDAEMTPRMADQFARQALAARALADAICEEAGV